MKLSVISGRANPMLATAIASKLGIESVNCLIEDFPDDEMYICE